MIHIDRNRVPVPPALADRAAEATAELTSRYKTGEFASGRIEARSAVWIRFKPALMELFRGKCAFCESPVVVGGLYVEHFRPKSDARNLNQAVSPMHYFWLMYAWRNLYLSCSVCNLSKSDVFPVKGKRAEVLGDVTSEHRLLIDPCIDDPGDHLRFVESGTVTGTDEKGSVTVDVYALNRPGLVEERRRSIERLQAFLRTPPSDLLPEFAPTLARWIADDQPYAGALRQILRPYLEANERLKAAYSIAAETPRATVVAQPPAEEAPIPGPRIAKASPFIEHVHLENIRAIEYLDLSFESSWKVLLGENATGKSTILESIALALAEPPAHARKWLRVCNGKTAASGLIRVKCPENTYEVKIDDQGVHRNRDVKFDRFLRGYGIHRLTRPAPPAPQTQSVANLFDPWHPLVDPDEWFRKLPEKEVRSLKIALRDLLLLPADAEVEIEDGRLRIPLHGEVFTNEELSAGYRDILALVVDILSGVPGGAGDPANVKGVVLLDEIGMHLHPRWRMEVVERLRQTFQDMQFIASTHDPLCLRTLGRNEAVVMRRKGDGVYCLTNLEPPATMRIDHLLTSPYFGLHTTIDPSANRDFDRYYALHIKERNSAEQAEYEELRRRTARLNSLLYTHRDMKLYEFVDDLLARQSALPEADFEKLTAEMRERVRSEWRRLCQEES